MIDYDDYFGGLTEEEYVRQTERHFKWLEALAEIDIEEPRSKCCMAMYCIYSNDDKHCIADDDTMEHCPYLEAIGEIARLSAELAISER